MAKQFPYCAAAVASLTSGVLTSAVWAAPMAAHPVALHPVAPQPAAPQQVAPHAVVPSYGPYGALSGPAAPAAVRVTGGPVVPELANTPGGAGTFLPGNVAQLVGPPANQGAAQAPGLAQASQYTQPSMNQPGQPPFGEMLYSMQSYMNQPGTPDFYGTFNPAVVQANAGVTPGAAYPNPVTPQTGVPSATTTAVGKALTLGPFGAGDTVGFYNGFGPGQPDVGFYSGFTTPR
jgi:hypothetical protein